MAHKPRDYHTPSKEKFEPEHTAKLIEEELPKPVPTPADDDHLSPEPMPTIPDAPQLQGVFRYVGEAEGIDYYGIWMERKEWVEIYDPFIAKKARGNVTIECQAKPQENETKALRRARVEEDRETYTKQQKAKLERATRNADKVLGSD